MDSRWARFSSCGSWAQLDLRHVGSSWARDQPASLALQGGFLTTRPARKPWIICYCLEVSKLNSLRSLHNLLIILLAIFSIILELNSHQHKDKSTPAPHFSARPPVPARCWALPLPVSNAWTERLCLSVSNLAPHSTGHISHESANCGPRASPSHHLLWNGLEVMQFTFLNGWENSKRIIFHEHEVKIPVSRQLSCEKVTFIHSPAHHLCQLLCHYVWAQ